MLMTASGPAEDRPHGDRGSALVVGGSSGLGLAIAEHLAARRRAVTVWSRTPPPGTFRDRVHWTRVDISGGDLPVATLPRDLRAVYHCAAQGHFLRDPAACSADQLRRMVETNLLGGISVLLQLLQILPPSGRFAQVSSLTARVPSPGWCVYGATKAAMEHLVHSVQPWAKQRGVTITLCYPGVLDTTFHAIAGASVPAGAVAPQIIAAPLVEAVELGLPSYVAPMDLDLIARLDAGGTVDPALTSLTGLEG